MENFIEKSGGLILVVEDNEINRRMLISMLSPYYRVISAENGKVGFDRLKQNRETVSLILLDLIMPIMDGYEFLDEVMSDPDLRSVPVIVTTTSGSTAEQIKALEKGASDFIVKPYLEQVLLKRVDALVRLKKSISVLQTTQMDILTGVYNSEFFMHYATETIRDHPESKFDIICTNVENFRMITSRQGKKMADGLLHFIANRFKSEIKEDELVGRIGTDRFAILVFHKRAEEYSIIEREVRRWLSSGPVYPVMLKYGVYQNVDRNDSVQDMCNKASFALDATLYRYGTYMIFYDDTIRAKKDHEQDILDHMEEALENREFVVYYQSKHNITMDCTSGAEALTRWMRPGKGLVSPAEFIPLFEKNGFIRQLDFYVWEEVCRFIKRRLEEDKKIVPISVNISRSDFDTQDLDRVIEELVEKYGIPKDKIHLEITESAYNDNPYQVKKIINKLYSDGFCIELDDFGKGYSTLSMLSRIPLNVVKLDLSIVQGLDNPRDHIILRSAINMSSELGMETVAEGCETISQAEELKNLGCTSIQGFYYSRPVPEEEFIMALEEENALMN